MANKTNIKGTRRLSKGIRTHNRRVKQAARKEVGPSSPHSSPSPAQPARAQKKQE